MVIAEELHIGALRNNLPVAGMSPILGALNKLLAERVIMQVVNSGLRSHFGK